MSYSMHLPEKAGKLTANDFPANDVFIIFEYREGVLLFRNSFWSKEGQYVVVYTEHLGYHTFLEKSIKSIEGEER